MYSKDKIERVCSLYASEWHLATMILPTLNKKILDEENFITFFETNFTEYMSTLTERANLKELEKRKVLSIAWDSKNIINYREIERYLDYSIKSNTTFNIIVNGKDDYTNEVNKNVSLYINKNMKRFLKESIKICIINCFDISEGKQDMEKIIKFHDKMLNTSGIKEIEYHENKLNAM